METDLETEKKRKLSKLNHMEDGFYNLPSMENLRNRINLTKGGIK